MPSKKKITKEELRKLQENAFEVVKAWIEYLNDLNDFTWQFNKAKTEGTTPPGNPPNPPGIPPR